MKKLDMKSTCDCDKCKLQAELCDKMPDELTKEDLAIFLANICFSYGADLTETSLIAVEVVEIAMYRKLKIQTSAFLQSIFGEEDEADKGLMN